MIIELIRYQAMVHCGSIRQTASILHMSKDCLRTGDKAQVRFRFIKHPEYIRPQQRMVFREGRTKAVGNVLKPLPTSFTFPNRQKPTKMQSRGQQNQNPNTRGGGGGGGSGSTAVTTAVAFKDDVGASLDDGVLDIGTDKRDNSYQRRQPSKRPPSSTSTSTASSSAVQITTKVQ